MDILDISVTSININKPRKQQESLFGKIFYQESEPLYAYFYNVRFLKQKHVRHHEGSYQIFYVKGNSSQTQKLAELDEFCKEHVKDNAARWFSKGLDENIIDEYYTSSLILSPADGLVMKLKVTGTLETFDDGRYDLLLRMKGLRFYKQRFIPEWELSAAKHVQGNFLDTLIDDSDNPYDDTEVEVVGEDMHAICNELLHKIKDKLKIINSQIEQSLAEKQRLENGVKNLEDASIPKTIRLLDEIADDLGV